MQPNQYSINPAAPLLGADYSKSGVTQEALSKLNNAMMKKTFGELLLNYSKGVLRAIPKDDRNGLQDRLSFLSNDNSEVALVALAGYDTWDTPINKLTEDQVTAGLRALSWVTTELVNKLKTQVVGQTDVMGTVFGVAQDKYAELIASINALSPFRAMLVMREHELNATSSRPGYYASSSSTFADVFLYWDPHAGCYGYHHCYYDYHHGLFHQHRHYGWWHGHYGHCYGDPFPLAHALGKNVIVPGVHGIVDMYGKLFDLQVEIAGDAVRLAGEGLRAIANVTGNVVDGATNTVQHAGHDVANCAESVFKCTKNGFGEVVQCLGNATGQAGHCLGHVGHDFGHCLSNVFGGCVDALGNCVHLAGKALEVCGHCGKCDCACPSGNDCDEGCAQLCGGVGACCYGTGATISKCFGSGHSSPDDSSSMELEFVTQAISDHEDYTTFTTLGTAAFFCCCGIPVLYNMGRNTQRMFCAGFSQRNVSASRIDCASTLLGIGMAELAIYTVAPGMMGPRVATNMAISGARCASSMSYLARTNAERKSHGGITHADKYFMSAEELNRYVLNNKPQGTQAGRDDLVSSLDVAARANTQLFNDAFVAKHDQSFVARRARSFVSCGGYGMAMTNESELQRMRALEDIAGMRRGVYPARLSNNPPPYAQQSFNSTRGMS